MKRVALAWVAFGALAAPNLAAAQTPPAAGAADPQAAEPSPAAPPLEDPATAQPPDDDIHRSFRGGMQSVATAAASPDLPAGTIRVSVVDGAGATLGGVDVTLGVLDDRGAPLQARDARTDATGIAEFSGLATGSGQSYRPRITADGATYAPAAFTLPMGRGYAVRIRRLPTTRDDARVFLASYQTFLEFREERLHVVQQADLMNMGTATYVTPEQGRLIRLPEGAVAFQAEEVTTDQHFEPVEGEGFRIRGSIAPGRASLSWGYDLDLEPDAMAFAVPVPFRALRLRVVSEALPGLVLDVAGMGDVEQVEQNGHRFLVAGQQRSPDDAQLSELQIRLAGIPGPGPGRWYAVALALAFLAAGAYFALGGGKSHQAAMRKVLAERKKALRDAVTALDASRAREEIGPTFHAAERERLLTELALLLRDEDMMAGKKPATA